MRWNLLESICWIDPRGKAQSVTCLVTYGVTPEFLLLEMMAQTGGVALGVLNDFQSNLVFAKVESAVFSGASRPADSLIIDAQVCDFREEGSWIESVVTTAGREIARSRILIVRAENLVPSRSGSITFHDAFMESYQVRQKIIFNEGPSEI